MRTALSDRGAMLGSGLGVSQCAPLGGRSTILTRRPGRIKPNVGATHLKRDHPLARGLVGSWLLNEGSGITARDSSGLDNHGTLVGVAAPSTPTSGWAVGQHGVMLACDGAGDYILTNFRVKSGPRSLIVWVTFNTLSVASGFQIMGTQEVGAYTYLGIQNGGLLYSYAAAGTGGAASYQTVAGEKYCLAMTLDGSNSRLYANADLVRTLGYSVDNDATLPLYLGALNGGYQLNGLLHSALLYNRTLSGDEISYVNAFPYCMFR